MTAVSFGVMSGATARPSKPVKPPKQVVKIDFSVAPSAVRAGSPVKLFGSVAKRGGVSGTVVVQKRAGDVWEDVASAPVVRNKKFSARWTPTTAGSYALRAKLTVGDRDVVSKIRKLKVLVKPTRYTDVAAGQNDTCGVRTDGQMFCWGFGYSGEPGDAKPTDYLGGAQRVGTDSDWTAVDVGSVHHCGLRAATEVGSQVWCWGGNDNGALGTGNALDHPEPVQIGTDNDWTAVSLGYSHTCGIKAGGELWCWGNNWAGAVGDGSTTNALTPQRIGTSTTWTDIEAGDSHTCGIDDGQLFCWGYNGTGQLGDDSTDDATSPTLVDDNTDWTDVGAGSGHTCAIRSSALYCWGDNQVGQLGLGIDAVASTPQLVPGDADWTSIDAGHTQSCGIRGDGELWCWGDVEAEASTAVGSSDVPVQAGTQSGWKQVDTGVGHTCGLRDGGLLSCWGRYPDD